MGGRIRLLHVDDDTAFAELTATFLERADDRLDVVSSTTIDEALTRLDEEPVECVVSDYDMPEMDGLELLERVRATHPDLPFVLFTGKGSEEVASEAISAGITDYLQKEQGAQQFTVLANRAVNAVERWRAEREAARTRSVFEAVTERSLDAILVADPNGVVRFANPAVADLFGYQPEELEGESLTVLMPRRHREAHRRGLERYVETGERTLAWRAIEFEALHADGHEIPVSLSLAEFETNGASRFVGIVRDVTEQRLREREREAAVDFFQRVLEVTSDAEAAFETKVQRLLAAGCEWLGLPYGFLTRIEPGAEDAGTQTIVQAEGDHELLQQGQDCPLPQSYCRRTIQSEDLLVVADASAEGWQGDPAYELFELESYIGGRVSIEGELYGTLCFAATTPRENPYSDPERSFVDLTRRWVGYELGREPQQTNTRVGH